jgi:hypothetical protein
MLEEKSKNQTRDGLGIPGLLAEPTGTDGFPVLCHQFYPSSLHRLANFIRRCTSCLLQMNKLLAVLHLFYHIDDQGQNTPNTVFPPNTGRW